MIGYRGCYRCVRDASPKVNIMIPFVRTKWEFEACLERIDKHRLGRHQGLLRSTLHATESTHE